MSQGVRESRKVKKSREESESWRIKESRGDSRRVEESQGESRRVKDRVKKVFKASKANPLNSGNS